MTTRHFSPRRPPPSSRFGAWILVAVVLLAVTAGAWALAAPALVRYTVDEQSITVTHGLLGFRETSVIERSNVTSVAPFTPQGWQARRMGTGRPGYCGGAWSFEELGHAELAGNCSRDAVLVGTKTGVPWVLTPPDPEAFVAQVDSGVPFEVEVDTTPSHSAAYLGLLALGAVMPLPIIGLLAVLPRRLRYAVGDGDLVVSTGLRTVRVPLAGATAQRMTPKITLRAFGTALPGFLAGWFRAEGQLARIWATGRGEGVWIHPSTGSPVWITPDDIPAFCAALRESGAEIASPGA